VEENVRYCGKFYPQLYSNVYQNRPSFAEDVKKTFRLTFSERWCICLFLPDGIFIFYLHAINHKCKSKNKNVQ